MSLVPLALGTACILWAMALDRWDVARFWPVLAFTAAVWAWVAFWWWRRRVRGRGNGSDL